VRWRRPSEVGVPAAEKQGVGRAAMEPLVGQKGHLVQGSAFVLVLAISALRESVLDVTIYNLREAKMHDADFGGSPSDV